MLQGQVIVYHITALFVVYVRTQGSTPKHNKFDSKKDFLTNTNLNHIHA